MTNENSESSNDAAPVNFGSVISSKMDNPKQSLSCSPNSREELSSLPRPSLSLDVNSDNSEPLTDSGDTTDIGDSETEKGDIKRGEQGRPISARSPSPKGVKTMLPLLLLYEPDVDAREGGLNGVPGLPMSPSGGGELQNMMKFCDKMGSQLSSVSGIFILR